MDLNNFCKEEINKELEWWNNLSDDEKHDVIRMTFIMTMKEETEHEILRLLSVAKVNNYMIIERVDKGRTDFGHKCMMSKDDVDFIRKWSDEAYNLIRDVYNIIANISEG